jgi:hypothetical protein
MRLFDFKLYENNALTIHMIPALQTSTGKAGLYDLVSSTFFTDAAGGNFIYNRSNYIDDNTIYYISGKNPTENLGKSGTITNNNVVATPNDILYFNGSNKLSLSNNIATGTNDWTIDWWEYDINSPTNSNSYHSNTSSRSGYGLILGDRTGTTIGAYASSTGTSWDIFQ